MATTTAPPGRTGTHRWWALGLIATAQFMVIMDTSIIGVALPDMQADLGFAPQDLSWVFNAYVIAFGGLLLLGGRLSDLLGARKVFVSGWVVLLAGSVLAGAAQSPAVELVGRAVQGGGAALIAPAALTLLMVLFGSSPKELTKALALYGAAAPAGGTAGVFLGGVITEYAAWPWVFYLNIPIALVVLAIVPAVMPSVPGSHGSHDVVGATTVTGGLATAVYTIVRAPEVGWGSTQTLLTGLAAAGLIVVFLAVQARHRHPLVRLGIFRAPALGAANVAQLLLGAAWVPMWFFLNLYLQQVLGLSAFPSGSALLPDDRVHHARHGARRAPRHRPVRAEGAARDRHGRAGRGPVRALARPLGRVVLGGRAARVAHRCRRHVARLHPLSRGGSLLRPPGGGRSGGRPREHELPGRVRAGTGRDDRRRRGERGGPAR